MTHDIVIIGAGPAGYVAAIRAGQAGLKTILIDRKYIGGMCLNWGCIPTKSLLESARLLLRIRQAGQFGIDGIDPGTLTFNWKSALKRTDGIIRRLTRGIEFLLKKNNVEIIRGEATIAGTNLVSVDNRLLETRNILIATGSRPGGFPFELPPASVLDLENLFAEPELPNHTLVFGDTSVAAEIAQFLNLVGKQVTLLLPGTDFLPGIDAKLAAYLSKRLVKDGVKIVADGDKARFIDNTLSVGTERLTFDKGIDCGTRRAVLPRSEVDIAVSDGHLLVDDYLRTNVPSIYAVGDCNGLSHLAHAASAQGLAAVNHILGVKDSLDLTRVPQNIYTIPEMAQIGKTEAELIATGVAHKISEFSLSANGKTLAEGGNDGFLRVIWEPEYGEVIGAQIVADNATDLISEAGILMGIEGTVFDLAHTIHAHPTISEVFMEAGFDAMDKPVHKG